MNEFPKMLYPGGALNDSDNVTVDDAAGEAAAAKHGYLPLGSKPGKAPAPGKLDKIAELTVPELSEKLPKLTDDELAGLHAIEEKGQGRTTALAAIDAEIAARAEASK